MTLENPCGEMKKAILCDWGHKQVQFLNGSSTWGLEIQIPSVF
jgi:hypothetical protein